MRNASNLTNFTEQFQLYITAHCFLNGPICVVGFFGNLLIAIGAARFSELRNKCALLIATLAAADVLTCAGYVYFVFIAFYEHFWQSNWDCFKRTWPALLALNYQSYMTWIVGLDRLLMFKYPLWYDHQHKISYMAKFLLPGAIYAGVGVTLGYVESSDLIVVPLCIPPTAYNGLSVAYWIGSNLIFNVLVVVTYVWAYKLVRQQMAKFIGKSGKAAAAEKKEMQKRKHLLESLLVVMAVYVTSWVVPVLTLAFINTVALDEGLSFHISLYIGVGSSVNSACNFVIYAIRSKLYRDSFKAVLLCRSIQSQQSSQSLFKAMGAHETANRNAAKSIGHVSDID